LTISICLDTILEKKNKILQFALIDLVLSILLIFLSNVLFLDLINHQVSTLYFWEFLNLPLQHLSFEYKLYWLLSVGITPLGLLFALTAQIKSLSAPLFGDSKWMKYNDAIKNNLFSSDGIILGKKWGKYIRIGGFEHVICFAPSGTGKTVSMTIPNLLTWDGSIVCTDIKLELFKKTSRFREGCGIKCFLWNPGAHDFKSHAYNPLDIVGTNKLTRVDELHKIASILIPNKEREAPIWVNGPRNLFIALAIFVLDSDTRAKTLGEIARVVKGNEDFDRFIEEILMSDDLDPICRMNLNAYLSTPEVTRGGIKAALEASLCLFENPIIDAATSSSCFDIRKLRQEKMTIYVGVTNDNIDRLSPLLNVFFQQVMDVMTRKEPDETEPHGLLFLLDEFTALRRMDLFKSNIGLLRSYRVRLLIIIQDLTQLYDTYGHHGGKAFLNVKVRVALTQSSPEDAEYISRLLGNKTVDSISKSVRGLGIRQGDMSESFSNTKRPLLLGQEIMRLSDSRNLIMIQGLNPICANKITWYSDKNLKNRNQGAIDLPKLKISLPTIHKKELFQENLKENEVTE
jgi:type IV secretion system protein VirD4|tara:strand:+ start:18826 stop:20541 length:1716 start_codon:yes stop_codon:yes gene_type:complete